MASSPSTGTSMGKGATGSTAPVVPSPAGVATPVAHEIKANWIDYDGTRATPHSGLLHEVLNKPQPAKVSRIILVDSHDEDDKDPKTKEPKEIHDHYGKCDTCKQQLKGSWHWPEYLFSKTLWKSNGYVREENIGTDDEPLKAKFIRCLVKQIFDEYPKETLNLKITYKWYEMTIASLPRDDGSTSIICYGVPDTFYTTYKKTLLEITHVSGQAERMWAALLHEITTTYDTAIWAIAGATRKVEKSRGVKPDFEMQHELLRHAIHLTEVLEVAVDSLRILSGTKATETRSASDPDQFWYRLLENLIRRSKANETRLHNEIQLALNLVTQEDSKATIDLSKSAQADSRAVLAITIITMIFLPATFVATLFGMSFFNYQAGQGWSMTGEIWIFWLVSALLTIITLAAYAYWLHLQQSLRVRWHNWRVERKLRKEDRNERKKQGRTPTMQIINGS